MPVWPVGTNSLAIPRRRASRSSSSDTVIFPIAQSEPTVRIDRARHASGSRPSARSGPRGGLRRSRSSTPCARASAVSSASSETNSCSPFSMSSPAAIESFSSSRHAGGNRPPCVATPTSAVVGSNGSASATVPTTGRPSSVSPARVRVEDRDHVVRAVADDAAAGLAEMRVAGAALREDQEPTRPRNPEPRLRRREAGRRRRRRHPATGRARAAGSRRGRRDPSGSRCARPARCRGPTRPCSRA